MYLLKYYNLVIHRIVIAVRSHENHLGQLTFLSNSTFLSHKFTPLNDSDCVWLIAFKLKSKFNQQRNFLDSRVHSHWVWYCFLTPRLPDSWWTRMDDYPRAVSSIDSLNPDRHAHRWQRIGHNRCVDSGSKAGNRHWNSCIIATKTRGHVNGWCGCCRCRCCHCIGDISTDG